MGTLQSELMRVGLLDPEKHRFDVNLQLAPPELQKALRRLKDLEEKFSIMDPMKRFMFALENAEAYTLEAKVASINSVCDYLDTL